MSGIASMPWAICSPSFDGCLPFSCMRGWLGAGMPASCPAIIQHPSLISPGKPPDGTALIATFQIEVIYKMLK